MRKVFARTKNVKAFHAGIEAVRGTGNRKAEMCLVHGAWGTGKTVTAQQFAADEGVTYVCAVDGMSRRSLLATIVSEIGQKPAWSSDQCFHQAVDLLLEPGRMLIVDEVDFLVETGIVETLRNLYDYTAAPIVMVGMKESLPKELKQKYAWLFDRYGSLVRFQTFGVEELADLAGQVCEVRLDESALHLICVRGEGRLRPAMRAFEKAERVARTNRLEVVTADHLKSLLGADEISRRRP